jgi:DNA polymerase III subunit delta'
MIEYGDIIEKQEQYISLCKGDTNCNSFLFESNDEVYLNNFMFMFAKHLLCPKDGIPCDQCLACQKVNLLSHSDMRIYPKNGKNILVDDIKDLIENIYLSPVESDKKVFILKNFSNATIQAQNKLLKILEEPPKNAYIILGVSNVSKVLPTVMSRCKKMRLQPLADDVLSKVLIGTNQDKVENIIHIAQGNLSKALDYAKDENFQSVFENCLDTLKNMQNSTQLIAFTTKLSANKDDFLVVLNIFESIFRDILLIRLGKMELLQNKNLLGDITQLAQSFDSDCVDKIVRKLCETKKQMEFNCNQTVLIDELLLYILEVKYYATKG